MKECIMRGKDGEVVEDRARRRVPRSIWRPVGGRRLCINGSMLISLLIIYLHARARAKFADGARLIISLAVAEIRWDSLLSAHPRV